MDMRAQSEAASTSHKSIDEPVLTARDYAKFAFCISPMVALIAFGVYCFFIAI
jgi:hypothetical protein